MQFRDPRCLAALAVWTAPVELSVKCGGQSGRPRLVRRLDLLSSETREGLGTDEQKMVRVRDRKTLEGGQDAGHGSGFATGSAAETSAWTRH